MSNEAERERLLREMNEIEEQYVAALGERERSRREYIDILVRIIELARVDDGALSILVKWVQSEQATREILNALIEKWITSMDRFE